jgi:hypothetical protein
MYILRYRTAALFLDRQGLPTRCRDMAREFTSITAALAWRAGRFHDPMDANCWMVVTNIRGCNHAN